MVRESLADNSKNAFLGLSSNNGVVFQQRLNNGASSESTLNIDSLRAPYSLKLIRRGDNFTAYASANGQKWTTLETKTVSMDKNVYIGLCVTSHNNDTICKAVFSNFIVKGKAASFSESD